jgi:predicted DNA-binding transcriptional regulator YafY
VDAETTPYVRTKPLHPSQQWVEDRGRGTVFSIQVIPNFELERELLGFGASLEVLAPERLRKRMKDILGWAVGRYTRE